MATFHFESLSRPRSFLFSGEVNQVDVSGLGRRLRRALAGHAPADHDIGGREFWSFTANAGALRIVVDGGFLPRSVQAASRSSADMAVAGGRVRRGAAWPE